MYYNLLQSDKVIKDIAQFEDAVNSIANPRRKKFFEDLLNDYKNHLTSSNNTFQCGAGTFVAGVALVGEFVTLK